MIIGDDILARQIWPVVSTADDKSLTVKIIQK